MVKATNPKRAAKGTKAQVAKKRERQKTFFTILASILLLVFLLNIRTVVNALGLVDKERLQCPRQEGNLDANLLVKYFDTSFCMYCILEESVLKSALAKHSNKFSLQKYDVLNCAQEASKYRFSGVPAFVFVLKNASREHQVQGYINEVQFEEIICELSGGC